MRTKQLAFVVAGILSSLAVPACTLDIPDLNNPLLDELENAPTAAGINTAATGLLVGDRGGKSATTGIVNQLGILGRESYDFEPADVRFVSELILGNLSKASPFGGAFWAQQYAVIRLAHIILRSVDRVADFSDEDKTGVKGFAHTMIAMNLITVIITHDSTGAVIDTDHPLGEPLGPFVSKDAVYDEIARLLDLAYGELLAAGKAPFAFRLGPGYAGFSTPETYAKFNRALKVKIACYQKKYQDALDALPLSFIFDDPTKEIDFDLGTEHVYSTASGDQTNALVNPNIYAHPKLETEAQKQADGSLDARYLAKVERMLNDDEQETIKTVTSATDERLSTTIKFKIYPTNISPVPIIHNEELILYKAEAQWFAGSKTDAMASLNLVRTQVGELPAITTQPANDEAFIDALLYERRYSLMFEGGHRWIDLRRFGRQLPLDAEDHTRNVRFPVPQAECDARPGEPACMITSSSP